MEGKKNASECEGYFVPIPIPFTYGLLPSCPPSASGFVFTARQSLGFWALQYDEGNSSKARM